MRWLVTGSHGLLGTDLVARLEDAGETVTRAPREALLGQATVDALVAGQDVVVNCAGWTDVDGAESAGLEPLVVNCHIPELLAEATRRTDARLVQLSTDYVFSGTAKRPYREDARTAPKSVYGRSKLAGENAVLAGHPTGGFVVRTAWLYGAHGPCFPRTIARLAAERGTVEVVDDQVGQPTWTVDVADLILRLMAADAPPGTYHATASGQISWFGFAQEVVTSAGLDPATVRPTTSDRFPRPAPRAPAYSVLGHDALLLPRIDPIGDWRDRWRAAAAEILA